MENTEIGKSYFKIEKTLFNQFQGFGGDMNYMYRSNTPNDEHSSLHEFRFIYNSKYSDSSLGLPIPDGVKWYDVIVIDWEWGSPNSLHFLMSTDHIEQVFNVKLK